MTRSLKFLIVTIAIMHALTKSLPAGTLLAAYDTCQVAVYNRDGTTFNTGNGNLLTAASGVCGPSTHMAGICLDSENNIYLIDNDGHRILTWNADGTWKGAITNPGLLGGQDLTDCSVDSAGFIYLAGTTSVLKVDQDGNEVAIFETPNEPESVELNPREDRLYFTTKDLNVYYLDLERAGRVVTFHTQVAPGGLAYEARQIKVSSNGDVVTEFNNSDNPDFIVRYIGGDHHEWNGDMVIYYNRFPSNFELIGLALDVDNKNLYAQSQGTDIYDDVYKVNYKSHGLYFGWNVDDTSSTSYGLEVVPELSHERSHHRHHDNRRDEDRHERHSLEFLEIDSDDYHSRH
jgi:hypothetical protein